MLPDLINTGGGNADREKKIALDQIHNAISGKKKGLNWNRFYEDLMKRHIELCVDLKDYRIVKDGLHQYRNLCQNVREDRLSTCLFDIIFFSLG